MCMRKQGEGGGGWGSSSELFSLLLGRSSGSEPTTF